jgi:Cu/Ag efflux protein CusF
MHTNKNNERSIMKTSTNTLLAISTCLLTAFTGLRAAADEATPMSGAERNYTGTLTSVDTKENVLIVKGWLPFNKKFNLGENCTYALLDKNPAAAADLRNGQRVAVSYRDVHGVLIADRVVQEAMRIEGAVKSIDANQRALILHRNGGGSPMQLAVDCKIVLRNGAAGTFADIKPGNHVTVTYETPGGQKVVRQIAQTSVTFTGSLSAVDLDERTLKAKTMFATKKFNLADNCTVVIHGDLNGKLSGLKPGDRLEVSYDEINGVNVASRIATGEKSENAVSPAETTSL